MNSKKFRMFECIYQEMMRLNDVLEAVDLIGIDLPVVSGTLKVLEDLICMVCKVPDLDLSGFGPRDGVYYMLFPDSNMVNPKEQRENRRVQWSDLLITRTERYKLYLEICSLEKCDLED